MDFQETEVLDRQDPAWVVASVDADVDTRLGKMASRIRTLQSRITKAHLEIAHLVDAEATRLPSSRMRPFLVSECGMSPAEAKTYLAAPKSLEADGVVATLLDRRASFGLIRALVATDSVTRVTALSRLAAGMPLYESSVVRIRRESAEQKLGSEAKREIGRRKTLDAASKSLAARRIRSFKADFLPFARRLVEFYNGDLPEASEGSIASWLHETAEYLKEQAAECAARFEQTFDTAALPAPWLHDYHGIAENDVLLARARDAIIDLAHGRFQAWDDKYDRPFDTDHDYIDRRIVEGIVWLFEEVELPKRKIVSATPPQATVSEAPYRLTSLEICAGAGGQAIGLHAAGFDALGLYEHNPNAVATLSANYPLGPTHLADVRTVDFTAYKGKVALVAGGVPCQSHSSLGLQRGRADDRDLFLEAVRLVRETEPQAFFFENVEGFSFKKNADYRAELYGLFSELGYESRLFSIRGDDYGLAQGRPRVAFVGFRDGAMARFRMPPVLTKQPINVGEALYDLVAENGWEGAREWAETKASVLGPTIVGASEASGRLGFSSNLRKHKWIEMDIDPVGIGREAPRRGHRGPFKLTLAMGARLQGFPSEWNFQGSLTSRKRQIANALPPVMAKAVGLAIYSALTGVQFDFARALQLPLLGQRPGPLATLNIRSRATPHLDE
ncbi:MAG: DNA (cytosine-5-)-methyltransferase [Rhizobiaceae bacterium]|nr:DNA (cytosine-5-)-methyltransferase [Rhizobiaceae bacterium]